jgi:hypothetical protein
LGDRLERAELVDRVFGGEFTADDDLFELLAATEPGSVPPLYIACGTEEDRLMPANGRLADAARARGVAVTTDFRPGCTSGASGTSVIQDVIAWLPLRA